jgi:hypothetical protein
MGLYGRCAWTQVKQRQTRSLQTAVRSHVTWSNRDPKIILDAAESSGQGRKLLPSDSRIPRTRGGNSRQGEGIFRSFFWLLAPMTLATRSSGLKAPNVNVLEPPSL